MLSFLLRKKKNEVQTLFSGRMNRAFVKQVREEGRRAVRGAFCEVVWLIPEDDNRRPQFDQAFPVVTKDISPKGIGVLHSARFNDVHVVLGLPDDACTSFVTCDVGHCSSLGYGFYQIGLHPKTVLEASLNDRHAFEKRQQQFLETQSAQPVTVD